MKIYTKTGDNGKTSLLSGKRVFKYNKRIIAYGSIDELNSIMGVIRDFSPKKHKKKILMIQNKLMIIASQLSNDKDFKNIPQIKKKDTEFLEIEIDKMTSELEPLKNFIIPGGDKLVSFTHLARCICRRAEINITILREKEDLNKEIFLYINRLSDYLFTLARFFSKVLDVSELKWNNE
jgi:cob(I)alamin adenosyltransferase